uniref:Uncharacterized protein n=1 Tax=Oryza glumipatula TaxID=40148 RepID=A0A0E0B0U3_9ORYZ
MVESAASLLLRYAGRSLQRPIPRALEELRLSPRGLKDSPRRLYSSDGVGTKSQPDKTLQLERAHQDLAEKNNKALEDRMIYHMGNLNRGLDKLEGRIDRLSAVLKEREIRPMDTKGGGGSHRFINI